VPNSYHRDRVMNLPGIDIGTARARASPLTGVGQAKITASTRPIHSRQAAPPGARRPHETSSNRWEPSDFRFGMDLGAGD